MLMGLKPRNSSPTDRWESLSERQREIALLLMGGTMSRSQIAESLDVGEKTVDSHRLSLLARLNLNSTVQLVHFGIRHGLIKVAEE